MTENKNDVVLEILKKLQADSAEIKQDLRDLKAEVNSIRSILGDLIKTDARRESNFASLEHRIDRIERRLDLRENP